MLQALVSFHAVKKKKKSREVLKAGTFRALPNSFDPLFTGALTPDSFWSSTQDAYVVSMMIAKTDLLKLIKVVYLTNRRKFRLKLCSGQGQATIWLQAIILPLIPNFGHSLFQPWVQQNCMK